MTHLESKGQINNFLSNLILTHLHERSIHSLHSAKVITFRANEEDSRLEGPVTAVRKSQRKCYEPDSALPSPNLKS